MRTKKRGHVPSQNELAKKAALLDIPAAQVQPKWSIGKVSERTGLSIDTLRYYERLGLIDEVARDASGCRIYSDLDIERIGFVRRLRATGMSVEVISRYVRLRSQGTGTADIRLDMLQHHRQTLMIKQRELAESLALLDSKIDYYQNLVGRKGTGNVVL
jgi:DNA-binding transcriptional MerR regulator